MHNVECVDNLNTIFSTQKYYEVSNIIQFVILNNNHFTISNIVC